MMTQDQSRAFKKEFAPILAGLKILGYCSELKEGPVVRGQRILDTADEVNKLLDKMLAFVAECDKVNANGKPVGAAR